MSSVQRFVRRVPSLRSTFTQSLSHILKRDLHASSLLRKQHMDEQIEKGHNEAQSSYNPRPYAEFYKRILNPVGYFKSEMARIDESRELYYKCAKLNETYADLLKRLGMKDEFTSWFAITILHVWMLNTRFKAEGLGGKDSKQELFNHLWTDVELKLHDMGVKQSMGRVLEDLLDSFYGQSLAYDEGLAKGDSYLAGALWKNFLLQNKNASLSDLVVLTEFCRQQLQHINSIPYEPFLRGKFEFLPLDQMKLSW